MLQAALKHLLHRNDLRKGEGRFGVKGRHDAESTAMSPIPLDTGPNCCAAEHSSSAPGPDILRVRILRSHSCLEAAEPAQTVVVVQNSEKSPTRSCRTSQGLCSLLVS
jgi:hypothetical protein